LSLQGLAGQVSRELGQVKREWNKKYRSVTGIFAGEA
jgi:hypothetical protein